MSEPLVTMAPQPPDSLGGVVAKLLRAERHLESLSFEVQSFVTCTPVSHVREAGPTGEVWVLLRLEPAPIDISVTIGDVLHQLRSAVDHLAYGLVLAAGGTPTKQTSFPILEKPPKANKPIKGLESLGSGAMAAVLALQPYQAGAGSADDLLWTLNELVNIDKHRHLHLASQFLTDRSCFARDPVSGTVLGGQWRTEPAGDGDVVGLFDVAGGLPADTEIHVHGQRLVVLAEGRPWVAGTPVVALLQKLSDHVTGTVMPSLLPFLGEATV